MGSQTLLAIVALIISIIAFIATILQLLQQYTATAEGFRRCADSVMGPWSQGTRRRFLADQVRFEVLFETPVIFLAQPSNTKGPILYREIHYLDGSPASYRASMTLEPEQQQQSDERARESVHTADDERASWVKLLQSLQRAERESRDWDAARRASPRGRKYPAPAYTLAVGVQAKRRSWDFMPPEITRPYAMTTMTHVVELAATLGLAWKVFEDLHFWNLRAEGNGLMLMSHVVGTLGLMITFSVTGPSTFREDRLIPNHDVKELCFGSVPTFVTPQGLPNALDVGHGQVHRTLEMLGVSRANIVIYKRNRCHVFPVIFEAIGFLGKTLRLRGSNFTRIPNPAMDFWPQHLAFKSSLFAAYMSRLVNEDHPGGSPTSHFAAMTKHWAKLEPCWPASEMMMSTLDIDLLESLHDLLDDVTARIAAFPSQVVVRLVGQHLNAVLSSIDTLEPTLIDLDANKQELFLDHYWDVIRHEVMYRRGIRDSTVPANPALLVGSIGADVPLPVQPQESGTSRPTSRDTVMTAMGPAERHELWCMLMCRMLCWLLLHSFGEADRCIINRDWKGSRMPVFVG